MMRAHCDRCDALVDGYPSWIEDHDAPGDRRSGVDPIWHIHIGQAEEMLCRRCRIAVLALHVKSLQLVKSNENNGHLADCRWDDAVKRYACAEGCDIKRINES